MARLGLILLGALAFGCDDPAVTSKVASVLEHGVVAASAECYVHKGYGEFFARFQALADGALFASWELGGWNSSRIYSRSETEASTRAFYRAALPTPNGNGVFNAHSGHLEFASGTFFLTFDDVSPPEAALLIEEDISEVCTGFNLSEFGVTE